MATIKLNTTFQSDDWVDISSEHFRAYTFCGGERVFIQDPQWLHVSESGGYRILDGRGVSHYVPAGWIHLVWKSREGSPHFVA